MLSNGICVSGWTFDELYGRDGRFLDGVEALGQVFVAEIPANFHGWVQVPKVLHSGPKKSTKGGNKKKYPRVVRRRPSCEVGNLTKRSPVFQGQTWQPYHIKDTDKGPEVWEIKWSVFWRKTKEGLPTRRHGLIVARNVLTGEVKYFLSNRVPGDRNPVTGQVVTLRWQLGVAFGRCSIESCFRQAKEELGMDHFEVRGWRCMHRHYYVTQLSHLFCARVRQEFDATPGDHVDRVSVEQVRSAINVVLQNADLPPACRKKRFEDELQNQKYYQTRNRQARQSHTKTRLQEFVDLDIDVHKIKSCLPKPPRAP